MTKILLQGFLFMFLSTVAFAAEPMYGLFMVVKGDIKVINIQKQTNPCKVGTKIFPGETIVSGVDSRAKVVMSDRNVINISPATTLKIEKYEANEKAGTRNVELNLIDGKVRNNVEQKYDEDKSKFLMKTPTAVAGVRGTQFLTSYDQKTQITQVVTLRGAVTLAPVSAQGVQTGKAVVVQKGEMTSVSAGGTAPEPPKKVPQEELKKMDKESSANAAQPSSKESTASNDKKDSKDSKKDPKDAGSDSKGEPKKEAALDPKKDAKPEAKGPEESARAPGSEAPPTAPPTMIDKKDMDVGSMTQEIRVPSSAGEMPVAPPPQLLPPPMALPPPTNPIIGDIINGQHNKLKVIVTPVPQ